MLKEIHGKNNLIKLRFVMILLFHLFQEKVNPKTKEKTIIICGKVPQKRTKRQLK